MLLVVVYHCILFWTGTWFTTQEPIRQSTLLPILSSWMNSFHIYGFTLISGYLFFFLKYEKRQYTKFYPFIVNKARRLLIPYIFVASVWVIPISQIFSEYTPTEVISKYVLGTSPSQLWFLLMLFGVFMLFYPLSDFFKKRTIAGAVVVILFYGVGLIGQYAHINFFQIFRACVYIPFFWLGFKIRQYGSCYLRKIPALVWLVVDILLFGVTKFLSTLDGIIFVLLHQGFSFALHIVGALMAFVLLQKLAKCIEWKDNKTFKFLSAHSMPVYLFHQQIIYIFLSCLNGKVDPYTHSFVNFIGAMAISLLISSFLMRFKWTRFLIGEK